LPFFKNKFKVCEERIKEKAAQIKRKRKEGKGK